MAGRIRIAVRESAPWLTAMRPALFLLAYVALCTQNACGKIAIEDIGDKLVVCYVGTWAVYRPGAGAFSIDNVDPFLCTHLIYSFIGLQRTNNTVRSLDPFNDFEEDYGKGSIKKAIRLKERNPDLKVSVAVGGWNEESAPYSKMAETAASRSVFISSAVNFVQKYGFDGFDVDWEFPTTRGGKPQDRENFVLLLKELKAALGKRLLTAAINPGVKTINEAYDIPAISKHLDFIHVMTYDYHGQWDNKVGSNAPLNITGQDSLDTTIKHLIKLGAPAHKLVIGIAAYGHTFMLKDETSGAYMNAQTHPTSFQGPYTRQDGFMGYHEICAELNANSSSWNTMWDLESSTPYTVNGNKVISYDDERSIALKVRLSMNYGVGGFMVWSIDTDDFTGGCHTYSEAHSDENGKFPLLKVIRRTTSEVLLEKPEDNTISASAQRTPKFLGILVILIFSFGAATSHV